MAVAIVTVFGSSVPLGRVSLSRSVVRSASVTLPGWRIETLTATPRRSSVDIVIRFAVLILRPGLWSGPPALPAASGSSGAASPVPVDAPAGGSVRNGPLTSYTAPVPDARWDAKYMRVPDGSKITPDSSEPRWIDPLTVRKRAATRSRVMIPTENSSSPLSSHPNRSPERVTVMLSRPVSPAAGVASPS